MTNHNYYPKPLLGIKSWAEEDRPREKLLHKGRAALTDAELIAILIGSGSREETALGLAQRILRHVDHNLFRLGRCDLDELMRFKGIGQAKAISITAALELGRRRQLSEVQPKESISSSRQAYKQLAPLVADLNHEEFWILLLNRSNVVISKERISIGGVSGTVVDGKIIFKKAIQALASSIILCHNHPSGNLHPSQQDIDTTKKLYKTGEAMDIPVVDHLIISEKGYYSFADEGHL